MKYILLRVAVTILKCVYAPISLLPLQNKITIMSRQSNEPTIDIRMLNNGMKIHYPKYKVVVLSKRLTPTLKGLASYTIHMMHQLYAIATSRVIVIDGYCVSVCLLKHKEETSVIQIWHAVGAIKKFGLQSIDTESGTNRRLADIMHMHENYDFVLSSSEKTADFFSEGFNTGREKIKFIGLPRIDSILNENKAITEDIKNTYGSDDDKKIVLYLPTFRKNETININEIVAHIDFSQIKMIVKLHPLDETVVEDGYTEHVIVDKKFSTYDLMHYADMIITDYSSLGVEAALLNKPLFFYVYDFDKYKTDPGINVDLFEEMGCYAVREADKLGMLLYEEYDYSKLKAFKNKYIEVDCEDCTKQMCDFIATLMEKDR